MRIILVVISFFLDGALDGTELGSSDGFDLGPLEGIMGWDEGLVVNVG